MTDSTPESFQRDGSGVSNKQVDKERQSIETLPKEIFVDVIQLYAGSRTPVHHLTTATLVCRRWRTVVEGTPLLWSNISGKERLHRIKKALRLSEGVPLNIEYEQKTAAPGPEVFFREIGPHIARWRTIVAQFHSKDFPLFELETRRAPILKKLHLCIYRWQAKEPTLFGGLPAPTTLEDFKVAGIPLSLGPLHLSGLKELRIIRNATLTAAMALVVIRNSPELEVLELDGFEATDSLESDQEVIQLPLLPHLVLDKIALYLIEWLLSNLSLPSLQHLGLACNFGERSPSSILPYLDFHVPALKHAVPCDSSIEVNFSGIQYGIWTGNLDLLFGSSLENNDVFSEQLFEWFVSSFGEGLTNIPVDLQLCDCPPNHVLARWLNSRVKVTRLSVRHYSLHGEYPMDDVIYALASPNGSPNWPLPFLETLDRNLVRKGDNQHLVNSIRTRQMASFQSRSNGVEETVEAPEPLKEIWLWYGWKEAYSKPPLDEKFIESMRDAAGEAKLYWYGEPWPATAN